MSSSNNTIHPIQQQVQPLIMRIRHPKGITRITVSPADTQQHLKQQIAQTVGVGENDFEIFLQENYSKSSQLALKDAVMISKIPQLLVNGVQLFVTLKQGAQIVSSPASSLPTFTSASVAHNKPLPPQDTSANFLSANCNHPPNQRCINCLPQQPANSASKDTSTTITHKTNTCTHPEGGSCLNCLESKKQATTTDSTSKDKSADSSWHCQHGANAKCPHCIDKGVFIQDIKHVSFTQYLEEKQLKCKGVHPPTAHCFNCTPPSEQRMCVDLSCTNHEPYPKGMCNKCLPPSINVYRQPYRHVDFAQVMNVKDIQEFLDSWTQSSHTKQKLGYLYGYYAEDPNYKGGVRAIIEAIYQPPQTGSISNVELLDDPMENQVDIIAEALSFEKIGWVFTSINHDTFLSSSEVRMAARFQEQYRVLHSSGYPFSTFITMVLRTGKNESSEVKPEVYMVSDLAQAMEKNNIFAESDRRKQMKVREPENETDVLPSVILNGKQVTEFEPEFLLVNVAHGYSAKNNFSILKHCQFPALNQQQQTASDLKAYLEMFKSEKSWEKYADFNLLIFLSNLIDIETAMVIAQAVVEEKEVPSFCQDLINQIIGM